MQLLSLVKDKYKMISVVGMAKNSGKTVTLNQLIAEALEDNLKLGITSIGRDGEKQDIVTFTEKPLIYINEEIKFLCQYFHSEITVGCVVICNMSFALFKY